MKKTVSNGEAVISYNNLWKLLIDRGLNKTGLQKLAGLSPSTISKLSKNDTVNTRVLIKICTALKCDTSEIMSVVRSSIGKEG